MGQHTFFASLFAVAAALVLLVASGCTVWRVGQASQLARESEPFQQAPLNPVLRLLVVGDSTGVGTGASAPENSLAGLLAQAYPQLLIHNRSRDGATFAGVVQQLQQLQNEARYDLVLIQAGGNDVIRLRSFNDMRADIATATALAAARGQRVLLMPAGNVGNAPFFFPPFSALMTSRARRLHAFVQQAAEKHGAAYVNLFQPAERDPFVQQKGLHARDGLHPSDAGYRVWLDELMAQTDLASWLVPARAP